MIKGLSTRFSKSEFFKNATILTSGTAIGQAISIFTAPILTRIYYPEDYGLLGIYMVFTALAATFSTLQYHNSIITAESDEEAKSAVELSLILNLLVACLITVIVFLFKDNFSSIYNSQKLSKWLVFAPLSTFMMGVNTIFSSWAIRRKKFTVLTYNRILSSVISPFFSILFGVIVLGPLGLFVGLLLSQILPTLRLSYYFIKVDKFKGAYNVHSLKKIIVRFKNFPIFSLPAEFVNNLSNQVPVIMLGQTANAGVVGWYNLSVRMLGLPSSLVSTAVADVFKQRASQDFHKIGTSRPIFMKVFKMLLLISLPPLFVLLLAGPEIFSFVFGSRWKEAGTISQILAILYAFKFVVSPLSYVTFIANKQWVGLLVDLVLFLLLGLVLYAANSYNLDYRASLLLYAISYSVLYFLTFYLSYKYTVNEKFVRKGPEFF